MHYFIPAYVVSLPDCAEMCRLQLFRGVTELWVPVGAAALRRPVEHLPEQVEVRGAARVLAGIGHLAAHLFTVEVADGFALAGEDAEAGYTIIFRVDVGSGVFAGGVGDDGRLAKPRCFLYSTSRSIGERAVTVMATCSRRLTAVPFQLLRNEVQLGACLRLSYNPAKRFPESHSPSKRSEQSEAAKHVQSQPA